MKLNKIFFFGLASMLITSCNDINEIVPEGSGSTADQFNHAVELIPGRAVGIFDGMFTIMGKPRTTFPSSSRADDFGFIMAAMSQDAEGPDLHIPNSGYNWFSACGALTSRTPSYANPFIRYSMPYTQMKEANNILRMYISSEEDLDNEEKIKSLDATTVNMMAQALAIRAFDYMSLAPGFQFSYAAGAQNEPCVPLSTLSIVDYTHNPRATVKEVYDLVIKDLTWAINHLGADRKSKMYINQQVAYGLRARAYLATEQWALAAADAEKAASGLTPASIKEVSTPSFYNAEDHNWLWGYVMSKEIASGSYATSSSWLGSFSKNAYACGVGVYACINKLLYDKISATDVRKGWWVDENLHSPLLSTISWEGTTGDAIATLAVPDVKEPYIPYTNVKFGAKEIPTETNDADFPFMRVEEMILIQVEGLAKSGNEAKAREILKNFVVTYRDPSYEIPAEGVRKFVDEIWFQRRVELWGEGFGTSDMMRLNKPLVRYHEGEDSNYSDAFRFNLPAKDPWLLLRFPQDETNTNFSIENNTGGSAPTVGINGTLKDGVTD